MQKQKAPLCFMLQLYTLLALPVIFKNLAVYNFLGNAKEVMSDHQLQNQKCRSNSHSLGVCISKYARHSSRRAWSSFLAVQLSEQREASQSVLPLAGSDLHRLCTTQGKRLDGLCGRRSRIWSSPVPHLNVAKYV